ncbi:NADH-ubiquinone oxidoreductase chain C [hydrothermal vent metagenome]|uniref:NADH-ubiquinone oxidoreductase chain C n=1 Tax=hydrothermal vent metagenome TaxID=652676 RepID=A0A3B1AKW6_9ZZZZ
MSEYYKNLTSLIRYELSDLVADVVCENDEVTVIVTKEKLLEVCTLLRDSASFACEQLIDVCGVDYLEYQDGTWSHPRFASVYHLLSIKNNHRIRVKTYLDEDSLIVDSVIGIWSCANWFEREAFDLYGILYDGHPDLRRILTDYGFVGHPFRKDFPLIGNVEMRYDEVKKRVVYEPVSIDARITQPKVIRDDHRYIDRLEEQE